MDKLLPCPFCAGKEINLYIHDSVMRYYWLECGECFCGTGHEESEEQAISAWNRRAQPSEKPLTLEELRQMDGRVWVCYQQETWGPQHPAINGLCCSAYKFSFDNYGKTWLAYRSKPKEEV